ncbi:hypothetical protein KOW79_007246 [Hemibagrus wyckioides]|uniref:Uncharacterized protein n=1 Tax=Hemibagrus wyckioides TaxID=337641 RepID=A0A9D3NY92_9TELE|nr:hypothetical protein KOW79_007246 [Hemibagrus wyckioides]
MCPSPGGIRRHTGRTQYLKLVAAEADRVLPSLLCNDGLACESLSPASDPGSIGTLAGVEEVEDDKMLLTILKDEENDA